MNLLKSVKIFCAKLEMTQKDVSSQLGITNIYLSKMLKDNNPKYIEPLANTFKVSVSKFVEAGE